MEELVVTVRSVATSSSNGNRRQLPRPVGRICNQFRTKQNKYHTYPLSPILDDASTLGPRTLHMVILDEILDVLVGSEWEPAKWAPKPDAASGRPGIGMTITTKLGGRDEGYMKHGAWRPTGTEPRCLCSSRLSRLEPKPKKPRDRLLFFFHFVLERTKEKKALNLPTVKPLVPALLHTAYQTQL